jgi:hypothetical protein
VNCRNYSAGQLRGGASKNRKGKQVNVLHGQKAVLVKVVPFDENERFRRLRRCFGRFVPALGAGFADMRCVASPTEFFVGFILSAYPAVMAFMLLRLFRPPRFFLFGFHVQSCLCLILFRVMIRAPRGNLRNQLDLLTAKVFIRNLYRALV